MNNKKMILLLSVMMLFVMTGCINKTENEEQRIEVQKNIGKKDKYEDFRKINNQNEVNEVKKIIDTADWENAVVSMSRLPDYRFVFQFKERSSEEKTVLFEIWISPNGENVEIVQGSHQYIKLTREDSETLFKIITGDKLN